MNDKIEHQGVIESITDGHVRVSIMQVAACSECKARALCTSSESKEKYVDVYGHYADRYRVGDTVTVCGSMQMGRKAVRFAFMWPAVITLLACFVLRGVFELSEPLTLAAMLLIVMVYFGVAFLYKDKLNKEFQFWIEETLSPAFPRNGEGERLRVGELGLEIRLDGFPPHYEGGAQ